ncbi:hypothetical protein [Ruminococcus gauvreauii]|uniref:hypothetical protein n=1 Tax=Ruminococcus gauvreauii TaxID=438033 RepID=UPI003983F8BC
MRKPIAVVMLLMLCFPARSVVWMLGAAGIRNPRCSLIPACLPNVHEFAHASMAHSWPSGGTFTVNE